MTSPDDADDEPPDARWCTGVAAALAGASERVSRMALAISDDWRDAHGQEWAERTGLLHRELGRVADEAAEIGAAIVRRAAEPPALPASPAPWQEAPAPLRSAVLGAASVTRERGPRLGAVAGDRTETDLGMRIAELSEPD